MSSNGCCVTLKMSHRRSLQQPKPRITSTGEWDALLLLCYHYTTVRRKRLTKLLSTSCQILISFLNSFTVTPYWQFVIKLSLKVSLPQPRRVATLPCEIAPTEAEQRQTERTRTIENVIVVDELILSQQDQPKNHHSMHHSDHFFHGDLGLKCLKRRPAQKLLVRVKFTGNPYRTYRTLINVNGRHWNTCKLVFTGTHIYTGTRTHTRVYVNVSLVQFLCHVIADCTQCLLCWNVHWMYTDA